MMRSIVARPTAMILVAIAVLMAACSEPAGTGQTGATGFPLASGSATAAWTSNGPYLIWLSGGDDPRHRLLFDWSGPAAGSFTIERSLIPAPDGHHALQDASTFISATGAALGTLQVGQSDIRDAVWAEDSRHVCVIALAAGTGPDGGSSTLWLAEPGKPARKVATVGQGGALPGLTACSLVNDRAVVVSDMSVHIPPPQGNRYLVSALVQVVALSTGAVLYRHDYLAVLPAVPVLVASSADGRFLIESPAYGGAATIRDATTG
jgi:hypothetical protein